MSTSKEQEMIKLDSNEVQFYKMQPGSDLNMATNGIDWYAEESWKEQVDIIYESGYVEVEY